MPDARTIIAAIEAVNTLNELARMTKNGFVPFSQCTNEDKDSWDEKIVYLDDPSDGDNTMSENDVIADTVTADGHHDAISHYGGFISEMTGCSVTVRVVRPGNPPGEDGPYVSVYIECEGDDEEPSCELNVIVSDGEWYIN